MPKREHAILIWLNVLIAVGMSVCAFLGQVRLSFTLFDWAIVFPAANICFSLLTFPVTDLIADQFGKKEASTTVWVGFAAQFITVLLIEMCCIIDPDGPLQMFRLGGWLVLGGSTAAYLIAQFWDVHFFHWIKEEWTGESHLWLRNNLSTFSSQLINSSIFITVVFGVEGLVLMLPGSMLVKWCLALADTPFVYLGRYLVRRARRASALAPA